MKALEDMVQDRGGFERLIDHLHDTGSQPGKPCNMRAAFFTGLMWP
ncbi:hypothetical protein BRDI103020_16300 [Brevundimonas diminuta]